jgi:RHS repeat-associated protein
MKTKVLYLGPALNQQLRKLIVLSTFFLCLTALMMPFALHAKTDPVKVARVTQVLLKAVEPGVQPLATKIHITKKPSSVNSEPAFDQPLSEQSVVIPGTNLSSMALDRLKVSETVTPETTALFGETIDLNTGALSLQQVDISIPGNFDIPVELRRIYKGASYSSQTNLSFGEWQLAVPSISTTIILNHFAAPDDPSRFSGSWGEGRNCSKFNGNPGIFAVGPNQLVVPGDFWSGDTLDIPGVASEKISYKNVAGQSPLYVKNWKFECVAGGTALEAVKATSPQGISYVFNHIKLIPTQGMSASNGVGFEEVVAKYNAFLQVTKITDRFGNSVDYQYTSGQLTKISSSDGRVIDIGYEHNPYGKARVKTVTANGQSWIYNYRNASNPYLTDGLIAVVRPDGRSWQFNLAALDNSGGSATVRDYYYKEVKNPDFSFSLVLNNIIENQCIDIPQTPIRQASVTHPNGGRLDLQFKATRFGRSNVPKIRSNYSYDVHTHDLCFVTNSVVSKSLSQGGLPTMNWQYSYSQNKGKWAGVAGGEALTGLYQVPAGFDAIDLRATIIGTPDGAKTVHVFSRRWDHSDGQEVATEYYDTNGSTLLRRIERQFGPVSTGANTQMYSFTGNENGTPFDFDNKAPHENYINKSSEITINFASGSPADRFTTEYLNYNVYGVAQQIKEHNSVNTVQRTTNLSFQHDTTNWVLNLETNRQLLQGAENISVSATTYFPASNPAKSLPMYQSQYGRHDQSHEYYSDGTVQKTFFASHERWIYFENYKRGKPQTIKLPNRYDTGNFSISLNVNNSGTIAWADDLNGNRTSYQYDSLNRLTLIDPADSQWLNTTISYDNDSSGMGALQQNITRGNYRKTVTLDGLMQPVLSKEWDAGNESQTARYINQQFNAYGKATFTSVPSTSPTESFGSSTIYDGLQRIVTQTNTANGDLSFSHNANNSIVVRNGKGYSTTTQYLAYGSPATELASQIDQPEGVTTSISYNAAGLPTSITQGGVTEIRRYNNLMEMCLQKRPETGIRVLQYNNFGQVRRFSEGLTGNGSTCTDYTNAANSWVTQTYDNLGAAWQTVYLDGTVSKVVQLDKQGNLLSLANGNNSWSYAYNSLHLPYQQNLSLDGKTFSTALSYNNLGHLQTKQYGGATLNYAPNALGQPTKVADTQNYATNVQYHSNGQLKSYVYGNGLTFSQTLDSQYKPFERQVKSGSTLRHGQRYRYDNNDNLDAITDLVQSNQSISLSFDGLDRLDSANGSWGSGNFDYDVIGNITAKQLGAQNLSYSYDMSHKRLNTVTGGYSFNYDDRGNVINNGKRSFQYNRTNQLVSSGTIGYQYDGHGRRVKKTGSSTGYSVYDLSGTLLLTDGPNGQTRYIHLGKELIAKVGSAAALEDKPGYTGHVEDKDLSLTYMQQRYYDPVVGRFYSNDPVGFTSSNPMMFNRYAYANNNPYRFVDPDGRIPALARMMAPPPIPKKNSSLPNIPGHPGVPSGSGSPPGVTNSPIILTNPIIAAAVVVIQNTDNSQSNAGNNGNSNGGTQTSSTTTWNGNGKERIDVENPNPEAGTGNIHYHDVNNTKYKYNSQTGGFDGLSKKQNEKLKNTYGAQKGIEKGKKILGESK